MVTRAPRSTQKRSSAASEWDKRQGNNDEKDKSSRKVFVELSEYLKYHPKPEADQIVKRPINGKWVAGVSMNEDDDRNSREDRNAKNGPYTTSRSQGNKGESRRQHPAEKKKRIKHPQLSLKNNHKTTK